MGSLIGSFNYGYVPNAVQFNGSTYVQRGADFGGNADGKTGIFFARLKFLGGDSTLQYLYTGTGERMRVTRTAGNLIAFRGQNSGGTTIFNISSVVTVTSASGWVSVLASWDLAATNAWLYVNDVSSLTTTTNTNDTIDYTVANHSVGATLAGASILNCAVSQFYLNFATSLNLSTASNRRKFVDADGRPVNLGADGSTPTGAAPILYLANAAASFHTNLGGGGGMTVTAGSFSNYTPRPGQ